MDDAIYTLQQLSEVSGIEARTIRSYIERDLLPGPYGMGPKAAYGPEHRDRLNVIRRLRDAQREITLDQIRSFLSQLGPEKIAAIAAGEVKLGGVESGPPPVSSALSYLLSITGGSAPAREDSASAPRRGGALRSSPPQASPASPRSIRQRSPRALRDFAPAASPNVGGTMEEGASMAPVELDFEVEPRGLRARPGDLWEAEPPATGGRTPFEELLGVLGAALTHENVSRSVRSETWHRVPITPDVELSVRGELDLDKLALLQRIGDHLRHLLMKGTRK